MPYGDPQEVRKLKEIYEKIRLKLERQILVYLVRKNLIPNEKKFDLAPDFDNIEDWKITTIIRKSYSNLGASLEKEDIVRIKGRLYISKFTLNISPSFLFDIDVLEKTISVNQEEIKKIIEKEQIQNGWQTEVMLENPNMFNLFDKKKEKALKNLGKTAIPMLKGIGFSTDESNMMLLGAIEHEKFTPDILPEDLVGLALRIRGEALSKKSK